MPNRITTSTFVALLVIAGSPGLGKGFPSIPGTSSILKGVPNVSSIGAGNAAGVLSYCVKNKLLGSGQATDVLHGLTKKPGVTSSSGYSSGQAGNILTGQGQKFSLNQVPSQLKSQACNAVLKQAPKLL